MKCKKYSKFKINEGITKGLPQILFGCTVDYLPFVLALLFRYSCRQKTNQLK